jgi:hypothetical protein
MPATWLRLCRDRSSRLPTLSNAYFPIGGNDDQKRRSTISAGLAVLAVWASVIIAPGTAAT